MGRKTFFAASGSWWANCDTRHAGNAALRDAFAMQLFHDLHLDGAVTSVIAGDGVNATRAAVILLLARRCASVFHRVRAATLFTFHEIPPGFAITFPLPVVMLPRPHQFVLCRNLTLMGIP
jgi:hypothetical protein